MSPLPRTTSAPIVTVALAGVLLAGCTGSAGAGPRPTADAERPGTATGGATGGVGPPGLSPTGGGGDPSAVPCGHVIDRLDAPPPGRVVAADTVALATGTVPANPTADTDPGRLFAKTGLVVRADASVVLSVDGTGRGAAWIGWGSPPRPGREQRLSGCPGYAGWVVFAGGFWVDEPACVLLTVRAGGRTERVRMRIGAPCPD